MCQQPGLGMGTPPCDLGGGVLTRSQVRKPGKLPMRKLQAERKKVGMCQWEETEIFNKKFHRCYYFSTIWLRNGSCSLSEGAKVGGRAWRNSLGQWVQGSLLFTELRLRGLGRERAIKHGPVWTWFLFLIGPLFLGGRDCILLGLLRLTLRCFSSGKQSLMTISLVDQMLGLIGCCRGPTLLSLLTYNIPSPNV